MTLNTYTAAYRIIDSNLGRTGESLYVIEDLIAFVFERPELAERLRCLRYQVRSAAAALVERSIEARPAGSAANRCCGGNRNQAQRTDAESVLTANFKRLQEGLRSLEEQFRALGRQEAAGVFESVRHESYSLEQEALGLVCNARRRRILATDIYGLTGEEHSRGRSNLKVARAMIDAGVGLIQYREKDKSSAEQLRECRELRRLTRDAGASFIVNDDPALAVMAEADGIHLGQDDYPVAEVRRMVGEAMAIGLSTHSPDQAEAACRAGVDYIGVGPIFQTFTKKDVCAPVGVEYLEYEVRNIDLPFVAIGGIKAHNLAEVVRRGADCVAMVTEIVAAEDIGQTVSRLKTIIQQAKESRL